MYFSNCDQHVDFTCSITGGQHLMLDVLEINVVKSL